MPRGSLGLTVWLQLHVLVGDFDPQFPLPLWGQGPHLRQCVIVQAKWHLNLLNGLSRVHERDRRQTTIWRNM